MKTPHSAVVKLTCCACRQPFEIAFDSIREPFACPGCGEETTYSEDEIARAEEAFGYALRGADNADPIDGIKTYAADIRKA
ncbi:hypothetical protein [Sphingomonas sp.]|uniref:hypothetical protein n=1 Tax=Sphingomonas sp. TaxID=28214 RepID=UPI0025E6FC77|nr:hypothetical protein [Sphingomonas sp.]MBV9528336.1 hypothetical protein [Sphingomonas sp.]